MKITLLGLEFALENLGCQALAYSFANEISNIMLELGVESEYTAVVFAASSDIKIPDSGQKVDCLKIRYKSLAFWRDLRKLFSASDLIVDFAGGGSFSDIYGKKRFFMATFIKLMAIKSKATFVLGPQTYGPYQHKMVRKLASRVIRKSDYVFARDRVSGELAEKLSKRSVCIAPDVAFALPYDKDAYKKDGQKINIGINPSGLLWNGGYSHAKLPLTVEYQKYCNSLLDALCNEPKYQIHLITHVGTQNGGGVESDYSVCCSLHDKYPQTILVDVFSTPMDAKTYISTMDVLVGARMHATIAAFSSGVATIPFSYSRKFEGLYSGIGYNNVIHACTEETGEAVRKTLKYIQEYCFVKQQVVDSMKQVALLQDDFRNELKGIVKTVTDKL